MGKIIVTGASGQFGHAAASQLLDAAWPNCPDAPVTMIFPKNPLLLGDNHNGCYD